MADAMMETKKACEKGEFATMALPSTEYKDPLFVLLDKERRTCAGCLHKGAIWSQPWCLKMDKPAKKKCARYRENE